MNRFRQVSLASVGPQPRHELRSDELAGITEAVELGRVSPGTFCWPHSLLSKLARNLGECLAARSLRHVVSSKLLRTFGVFPAPGRLSLLTSSAASTNLLLLADLVKLERDLGRLLPPPSSSSRKEHVRREVFARSSASTNLDDLVKLCCRRLHDGSSSSLKLRRIRGAATPEHCTSCAATSGTGLSSAMPLMTRWAAAARASNLASETSPPVVEDVAQVGGVATSGATDSAFDERRERLVNDKTRPLNDEWVRRVAADASTAH
mmetsp:Transcript_40565/g.111605  ORF Transcript_40565/g.111605 Transcript_40565/m.111605 type:complete len:264 (+) Transcript_40565:926-1717(+)